MIDFSKRIRELRIQNKISQVDLAKRLNVTKQAISSYENGNRSPSHEIIISLSRHFNVSTDYLYGLSNKTHVSLDVSKLNPTQVLLIEKLINELEKNN